MINVPPGVIAFVVVPTFAVVAVLCVISGCHRHALSCRDDLQRRVRVLLPYAVVLGLVLLFNAFVRSSVDDFSQSFGINFTDTIHAFEGEFVPALQDVVPEATILYFDVVYVVGYAVLLAFPLVGYAVLDDLDHASTTLLSYALNYLIGGLCYVVIVAYGPRNRLPHVEQHLYTEFPDVQYLTAAVNTSSNVFPSLHASMAMTVLLLAWYSRDVYRYWLVVAAILAPSVFLATMVLGIHWLADVIAGIVLGFVSVSFARWLVPRIDEYRDGGPDPEPITSYRY